MPLRKLVTRGGVSESEGVDQLLEGELNEMIFRMGDRADGPDSPGVGSH